ncbi:NUDIX hydrolase [Amycolatopsis sp. Poz14]|uniref:NUDIX hydrolase n=1 Tax=Amycolatopsis sp. Poz14 TaxID=1447705 RepID=UPI001EE8F5D8|nr:NUDIX domain-containing protein [Amycolatopsis sp. Poz14]MCG3756327.1 NUDIX domain-containing protein [Amycolatopsis sp. Poz14]
MARVDYYNDPNAPKANSIAVAVSAFIQDDEGRILMIRRTDNDLYAIPGGQLELGETLVQAVVREVREETGIECEVTGVVGLYSNPDHVIAYDDGEVRQEFSICFRAKATGGSLRTSTESSEVSWVHVEDIPKANIHPSITRRIHDALSYRATPFYS